MSLKAKRRELMGVVGGAGVVGFLIGVPGGAYSFTTAIVVAFAIWIMGAVLVNLFTR